MARFVCTCQQGGSGTDYGTVTAWNAAVAADITAATTKVFAHGGITGTVGDGASVEGQSSGATATVAHATATQIMLTGISGTFQSGEEVRVSAGNAVTISDAGGDVNECVLAFYDDGGKFTEAGATLSGWTTDSTHKVILEVADGERAGADETDGASGNGFLWEGTDATVLLLESDEHIVVDGIQFAGDGGTQRSAISLGASSPTTQVIKNVTVRDFQTDRAVFRSWQEDWTAINCLMYNISGSQGNGFKTDGGSGDMVALHCGAYNCSDGANAQGFGGTSSNVYKNCWAFDCDDDFGSGTKTTCLETSDVTAVSDQFVSITGGSEDFRIKDTDADLYDAGTDLSAEIDDVDEDWLGTDRTTRWDIGPDYYTSGSVDATPTAPSQSLSLTLNAPTVSIIENATVTPSEFGIEITLQAPTVSIVEGATVTPDAQALSLTLNAPTVNIQQDVTPTAPSQSLSLTLNAPTVSTDGNPTVIPDAQALSLTLNAPTVNIQQDVTVTPDTLSLGLTLNAPTVGAEGNESVIAPVQALSLTLNAPNISTDSNVSITPDPQALSLTLLTPTFRIDQDVTVVPDTLTLTAVLRTATPRSSTDQTMHPPVWDIASLDADVQSYLGADPVRLFPFGAAPDRITLPYAVWQTISGLPEDYITNAPDLDLFVVQIDVYANSPTEARAVGKALRDALEAGKASVSAYRGETKELKTERFRCSFDMSFLTPRQ